MAQATLDHVLEEIKSLEPDEMRQVQQAIEKHLAPSDYSPEEKKVLQNMLNAGLLTEIKPRRTAPCGERRRIEVPGKPVSETIIEERR